MSGCAQCGWPAEQPVEILSRHTTSEGVVVYSRCVCGALQMWLWSPEDEAAWLVARSGRAAVDVSAAASGADTGADTDADTSVRPLQPTS